MRGLLTTALTAGALLAIPAAAQAALTLNVTKVGASIEPAAVVQYQVVVTGTPDAAGETLSFSSNRDNYNGMPLTFNNVAISEPGAGASVAGGVATLANTFNGGADSATFTFDVTLPDYATTGMTVTAEGSVTGTDASPATDVYKGDPTKTSKLYTVAGETTSAPAGLADWWAPKDSTTSTTFTIVNWGDGPAYNVFVETGYSGSPWSQSPVDPQTLKAGSETEFDWEGAKFVPVVSADCVATAIAGTCAIGEIPAGGSKTVTVTGTGLSKLGVTVYAQLSMEFSRKHEKNRSYDTPGWNDTDNYTDERSSAPVKVTDGKSVLPKVSIDGPSVAGGRTDVSYPFEVANGGPDAITHGVLRVSAPSFTEKGAPAGNPLREAANNPIDSLKSITLSSGATCAPAKGWDWDGMKYVQKDYIGMFDCPVTNIPSGARITGTVVANYATGRVDSTPDFAPVYTGDGEDGNVNVTLYTAHFHMPGSTTSTGRWTRLNRASTSDLDISVKSAAQIGSERLGLHVVTIKNNGPSTAKNVSFGGSLYKLVGKFEPTLLPGNCTGVVVSSNVNCAIGDIASGASATITIPVIGAKKLGTMQVATYWTAHSGYDPNDDNDTVAHVQEVVKAALAPFAGVKIVKAPAVFKFGTLGKTGLKSTVTVPGPSVVTVDITVSRLVAQQMGLVKGGKARAKAPAFIKIGTGKKVMKASGKAVVVTKLTRAYKAKVLKLRKPLKVQRVVTVVSTAALTKGATHMATNNMTLRK